MTFGSESVRVRVPATSANLGPGFDTLGLALQRYDEVEVRAVDSGLHVDVIGIGCGEVSLDEGHLVVRALRATLARLGEHPTGLRMRCENAIPHGRGLGSSAAAVVAGILAARALVPGAAERLPDAAMLALAAEFEGHPDNVAPCLLGGMTIAWCEGPLARAVRLVPHPAIRPLIFLPPDALSTHSARGLLPESVPHRDAARNAGRAALLVHALTTDPGLLLTATEDRLHQPFRAVAMRPSADLMARLRGDGIAAVVSGAGPAVLALVTDDQDGSGYVEPGWSVCTVPVDLAGAVVLR